MCLLVDLCVDPCRCRHVPVTPGRRRHDGAPGTPVGLRTLSAGPGVQPRRAPRPRPPRQHQSRRRYARLAPPPTPRLSHARALARTPRAHRPPPRAPREAETW